MNQEKRDILKIEENFKDILENKLTKSNNEQKSVKIKNVKYVGDATWNDEKSGNKNSEKVYIIVEEVEEVNHLRKVEKREQIKFYLGDRCVAATSGNSGIIYSEKFEKNEKTKMQAMSQILFAVPKEKIEEKSLNNLQNEEIAELLSAYLGKKITKKEIEKEIAKMDESEIKELQEEKEEQKDNDENDLSKKQSEKIKVNGIQRVDLNKLIDGTETLGKRLDLQEYDNLYVIYSDKVDEITNGEKRNNTTYSLVGMTKDGEARVLNNEFEMDKSVGNNANREQTKIRENNTATKDNKDLSVYTRKSNGTGIGCENDMGIVNMFFYQKTKGQNENVGIQMETSKTRRIPIETREIMNRNKGIYQKENVRHEIEKHTKEGCNPKDVKDFDGDKKTYSHIHIEKIESAVDKIFEYGDISEIFTKEEVKEKIIKEIETKQQEIDNKLIRKVANEMDEDAQNLLRVRNK